MCVLMLGLLKFLLHKLHKPALNVPQFVDEMQFMVIVFIVGDSNFKIPKPIMCANIANNGYHVWMSTYLLLLFAIKFLLIDTISSVVQLGNVES